MKRNLTLALAATMFLLTVDALPHHASAADTAPVPVKGKGDSTDQEHKDWIIVSGVILPSLTVAVSILPL
jgi:hypothetical protein